MDDTWFVKKGDNVFGPTTLGELKKLLAEETISKADLASKSAEGPWSEISEITKSSPTVLSIADLKKTDSSEKTAPPSATGAASAPSASTASTSLPPDLRASYLQTLTDAKPTYTYAIVAVLFGIFAISALGDGEFIATLFLGAIAAGAGSYAYRVHTEDISTFSDGLLQERVSELKERKRRGLITWTAGAAAVVLFLLFSDVGRNFVGNVAQNVANPAQCKVVANSLEATTFPATDANNNPTMDFGYVQHFTLQNVGEKGTLRVEVDLSTPEGNFKREREIGLDAGQSQKIDIQFPEPTLASGLDDVQAHYRCR